MVASCTCCWTWAIWAVAWFRAAWAWAWDAARARSVLERALVLGQIERRLGGVDGRLGGAVRLHGLGLHHRYLRLGLGHGGLVGVGGALELLAVGEEVLGRGQSRAGETRVRGHRPVGTRLGVQGVVALRHGLRGGDGALRGGDIGRSGLRGGRECGLRVGQRSLLLLHLQPVLLVLGVGELRGTRLLHGRLVRRHDLLVGVQLGVEGAQVLGGQDLARLTSCPGLTLIATTLPVLAKLRS